MKMTSVIGCVSCGKPALLVDDEAPKAFPACFWCLAERRPGAAKLFLDEVRNAERERVIDEVKAALKHGCLVPASKWSLMEDALRRLREASR